MSLTLHLARQCLDSRIVLIEGEHMKGAYWLDRGEYPFASRFLDLTPGRMHYVDEGQGEPVVLVHGTPTWSFLYRHIISGLSSSGYRCVAPDLIGFGLSDKPRDWSYRPEDHARDVESLNETLGPRDITLVVHDFGGPIGLAYALAHPENVRRIVLSNTWMWSGRGERRYYPLRLGNRLFDNRVCETVYTRYDAPTELVFRMGVAERSRLPERVLNQYLGPQRTPDGRRGAWELLRHVVGSADWYDRLWAQRRRLADTPALIVWGAKDPFFGRADLARWVSLLHRSRTVELHDTGHFCGRRGAPS